MKLCLEKCIINRKENVFKVRKNKIGLNLTFIVQKD